MLSTLGRIASIVSPSPACDMNQADLQVAPIAAGHVRSASFWYRTGELTISCIAEKVNPPESSSSQQEQHGYQLLLSVCPPCEAAY
jgi:hypothetical protein